MAMKQGRNHGQPFTILVGHFPYGSYPDHNMPIYQTPPPLRQAITHQVLTVGDRRLNAFNHVGLMVGTVVPKVASITVIDDDFTTGVAVLTLGKYTLTSDIDYVTGGGPNVTAANMATAINYLSGFTATAVGAVVLITFNTGPANEVDFSVVYYGTHTNLTLSPTTGSMNNGAPNFGAVDLI